jgi:hypothetical protein
VWIVSESCHNKALKPSPFCWLQALSAEVGVSVVYMLNATSASAVEQHSQILKNDSPLSNVSLQNMW